MAAAPTNVSQQQADAFQQKLTQIVRQAESKSDRERQTILTEGDRKSVV